MPTALVTVPIVCSAEKAYTGTGTSAADLVAVAGNHVFGYRDAPMQSVDAGTLSFFATLDLGRSSPKVTVQRVMFGPRFSADGTISLKPPAAIDKALVVSQSDADVKFALIGSGLTGLKAGLPAEMSLDLVTDIGAVISVPRDTLKNVKQVVFAGVGPGSGLRRPAVAAARRNQGWRATSITVAGSDPADFDHVEYHGQKLHAALAKDEKSVAIELPMAVIKQAGTLELVFYFKTAGKITYTIQVFDTKVDLPMQVPAAK